MMSSRARIEVARVVVAQPINVAPRRLRGQSAQRPGMHFTSSRFAIGRTADARIGRTSDV
jgi:hypothetical protein